MSSKTGEPGNAGPRGHPGMRKRDLEAAQQTLMESYQAIPALKPPPKEDPIAIAREEHLQHVAREGLSPTREA